MHSRVLGVRHVALVSFFAAAVLCSENSAMAGFNISGGKWGSPTFGTGATVTWSLMPTGATSGDSSSIVALEDFMPAGFKAEIEAAFDDWSQVADITFVEVTDTDLFTGDIRIGGHEIPGSILAHANFPGTGPTPGDIHFDTLDNWGIDAVGGHGIRHVAVHEIGHSIGLAHATNTVAIMNPTISGAFPGLFPDDIAGSQLIYGVAPGFPALLGPNTQLTLTENSFVEVSVSALSGAIDISDMAPLTGMIDARITRSGPGMPTTFSVKGAEMEAGDMMFSQDGGGITVTGDIMNTASFMISNFEAAVDGLGAFDFGGTQFGVIDGMFSLDATILGNMLGEQFDFFESPTAFPLEGTGSITETPNGSPGEFDTLVQMPFAASVDFTAGEGAGEVEVLVTISGLIEATAVVPEPSAFLLAMLGVACVITASGRPRQEA